jgi:hypothetical protein
MRRVGVLMPPAAEDHKDATGMRCFDKRCELGLVEGRVCGLIFAGPPAIRRSFANMRRKAGAS